MTNTLNRHSIFSVQAYLILIYIVITTEYPVIWPWNRSPSRGSFLFSFSSLYLHWTTHQKYSTFLSNDKCYCTRIRNLSVSNCNFLPSHIQLRIFYRLLVRISSDTYKGFRNNLSIHNNYYCCMIISDIIIFILMGKLTFPGMLQELLFEKYLFRLRCLFQDKRRR